MTKDEVLAMELGPEMNALVELEVMGRQTCIEHRADDWCRKCQLHTPRRFSVDWGAAGKVVEKINGSFKLVRPFEGTTGYHAAFGMPTNAMSGKTAPEAICKAALLATLGEE